MTRFASVVLDVDSTLSTLEGIDWLAARRDDVVRAAVEHLTAQAMAGEVPLDAVYERRLALVRPQRAELEALGEAYVATIVDGAVQAVAAMRRAGVRLVIVSGGLRAAILPLAARLGIAASDVHAVDVGSDISRAPNDDALVHVTGGAALTTPTGKRSVVESLALPTPTLAIGDGMTDAEIRPAVAAFGAFVGVVHRPAVVERADLTFTTFAAISASVLHA